MGTPVYGIYIFIYTSLTFYWTSEGTWQPIRGWVASHTHLYALIDRRISHIWTATSYSPSWGELRVGAALLHILPHLVYRRTQCMDDLSRLLHSANWRTQYAIYLSMLTLLVCGSMFVRLLGLQMRAGVKGVEKKTSLRPFGLMVFNINLHLASSYNNLCLFSYLVWFA